MTDRTKYELPICHHDMNQRIRVSLLLSSVGYQTFDQECNNAKSIIKTRFSKKKQWNELLTINGRTYPIGHHNHLTKAYAAHPPAIRRLALFGCGSHYWGAG